MNKSITILLLLFFTVEVFSQIEPKKQQVKDTTIIMLFEKCRDLLPLNCWLTQHSEYTFDGLIRYDEKSKKIQYEYGYFLYNEELLNNRDSLFRIYNIDSLCYMGLCYDSNLRILDLSLSRKVLSH